MDDGDMSLLRKKPASGPDAGPLEYSSVEGGAKDGNVYYPANELVRIRTRTGHQILLHNTEDLIYISHGSGNSWIEMTGNGKIDIYAKDSISVHSENDINFSADRDINFKAGRDINLTADKNFFITTAENIEIKAGKDGRLYAKGSTHIRAGLDHIETSEAGKIFMNSTVEAIVAKAAFIPQRVPQHEPWKEHEHLDPKEYLPESTTAIDPATVDPDAVEPPFQFPPIPDTFKKPTN
jgi:hypothetical protein